MGVGTKMNSVNTGFPGSLDSAGPGIITDHNAYRPVNTITFAGINYRLKIRAAVGSHHPEANTVSTELKQSSQNPPAMFPGPVCPSPTARGSDSYQ